ncbi:uncharacterized protein LOC105021667 [Esox lucius]|uniref:uncharacterized protein LOC105021667 n=1 Tax=Esox lucius TaxID=8010 RepID=UPI000661DF50|nr:uncharacterized protein LOC105021667 [Esox lucius]
MDALKAGFNKMSSLLGGKTSYFVTIIGLFVYHVVFDTQLTCLTKPGVKPEDLPTQYECNVYIAMPPFILFFLILWLDGEFQQVWTIVYRCGRDFWQRLFSALFKATAIGLLWVVSVLLDGDWYACHNREELLGLNTNGTYTKEKLKRKSVVIGLKVTLALVFLVAIFNAVPYWCYLCCCCERTKESRTEDEVQELGTEDKKCCSACCYTLRRSYHRVLFQENILIEMENIIQTDVKRTARDFVVQKGKDLLQPTSKLDPGDQGSKTPGGDQGNYKPGGVRQSSNPNPPEPPPTSSQASRTRVVNVDNLDFDKIYNLPFNIMKSVSELGQEKEQTNKDSKNIKKTNTHELKEFNVTGKPECQPLVKGHCTSGDRQKPNPDPSNPT